MLWLGALMLGQAVTVQQVDPLTALLQSPNPGVLAVGLLLAGLFGADKVAFWYTKLRGRLPQAPQPDSKSLEALVDTQRDLTATVTEIAKTVDKLEEYCQRHFEQTGLELRSVREELRAIRERLERTDGQPPR